ncbi:MAG: hypothetical protein M1829_003836 [Trizodia sp. TS-e1964]|nr:MAG: hypothetical protein M1829_003836 [Trizodia sp. TS-e1964]
MPPGLVVLPEPLDLKKSGKYPVSPNRSHHTLARAPLPGKRRIVSQLGSASDPRPASLAATSFPTPILVQPNGYYKRAFTSTTTTDIPAPVPLVKKPTLIPALSTSAETLDGHNSSAFHNSNLQNAATSKDSSSQIFSPRLGTSTRPKSPGMGPILLTGAAAMEDSRRLRKERARQENRLTSPNPAKTSIETLFGAGVSRPQDAPAAVNSMSEGMTAVASVISIPEQMRLDSVDQTSPRSMSSIGTFASTAPTATANSTSALSTSMDEGAVDPEMLGEEAHQAMDDVSTTQLPDSESTAGLPDPPPANRSSTFPGPLFHQPVGNGSRSPARGMSLPMAGLGQHPASESPSKKHRCPYCSTEFTRHHNLKSHLLTHSHEKPYVCQTCSSRFRRLHDLKRHTKLHTGERPHTCPKCGRKFARGDALARHNKGQSGCAGRRESTDSFAGEDEYAEGLRAGDSNSAPGGNEGMEGLVFTEDASGDIDGDCIDDDEDTIPEPRSSSTPNTNAESKTRQSQGDPILSNGLLPQDRQHNTYPPGTVRALAPPRSSLYPPNPPHHTGNRPGASPRLQTSSLGPAHAGNSSVPGGSVFAQGGMTESPKPLSPAGLASYQMGSFENAANNRNRSPSLTTQWQKQQFGRKTGGRTPPPITITPKTSGAVNAQVPHLPSLPGLSPTRQRYNSQAQASPTSRNLRTAGHIGSTTFISPTAPTSTSSLAKPAGSPGSISSQDPSIPLSAGEAKIWDYLRVLEQTVGRLNNEVAALKQVIANIQKPP